MLRALLLALLVVAHATGDTARYDNYKVYRVKPTSQGQLDALRDMQGHRHGMEFWREVTHVGNAVDIMVPPHKQAEFSELMTHSNFNSRLLIDNVQKNIDEENPLAGKRADFGWTEYHRLDKIYAWMDSLVAQYPQVTSILAGQSYEGREIRGVKISYKSGNPGVFIEAGIHAREWISPATVTFILNELLTSADAGVRWAAENYDWYFLPSTNPDGYEYTHTADRMWRKTRSDNGFLCKGADPNRNWDFHWMENGGASGIPCDNTYAGATPFSEVEIRNLSAYITSVADKIDVYLAFHSASQTLMLPYGYTLDHVPDYDRLFDIATRSVEKLAQRYGTQYEVGNIPELLYIASGSSGDWVRGVHNTSVVYTYELRDKGEYGFILPASQIIPSGEETLDSVISIVQDAWTFVKKH